MKRNILFVVFSILALLTVVSLFTSVGYYTDYLFFREVGYQSVFMKELLTKFYLFILSASIAGGFFLLNMLFANRLEFPQARVYFIGGNMYALRRQDINRVVRLLSLALVGVVFLFSGLYMSQFWKEYLLFKDASASTITDPIFNRDVSFYMFRLSFLRILNRTITVLLFITVTAVGLNYLLRGGITLVEGLFSVHRTVKLHIGGLLSLLILSLTLKFYLDRYGLLFREHGILYGASYTDVKARLMMLNIMCGAGVFTALGLFFTLMRRRLLPSVIPLAVFVLVYILGLNLYPSLLQSIKVTPNELELERPYIENHIRFTRLGYDLERVKVRPFQVDDSLSMADIERNLSTIRNIRLWDEGPLLKTYSQLQQIRTYYRFVDVDNDRYRIGDRYIQVMLSPRELSYEDLPGKSWINETLVYTHGIGLAMGPVSGITREGLPEFIIKDIPPVSTVPELKVTRPEIYYGENTNEYVIVNTKVKEFSYPTNVGNVYTHYQGEGGVRLSSFPLRIMYALRFGSLKIILSSDITSQSRVIYYRDILERAERVAPFLAYDRDPYMVVSDDGRLYWILDAYTYSRGMPYSRPIRGGINYIRNPVKVTIDAYNGRMDFYVVDREDIVIKTYQKIYPGLFKDASEMPESLRLHIRYPRNMMRIQAEMFATYHMTDPRVFYNKEDLWEIPVYRDRKMDPYYLILTLPEEDTEEFVLMIPFTPAKRDNLAAWMAARCDGEHYGEIVVYTFPRDRLVFGPRQIDARVDQNAYISQQLTLWGQKGSDVIRGSLLIIPIERSLLYVQPLYLVATDRVGLPELRRVIVAYGNEVVMEETLQEAVRGLFGGRIETTTGPEVSVPEGVITPEEAVREALQYLKRAREALRSEDWRGFGENLTKAEERLERALKERVK